MPGWHTIIRGLAPQAGGFRRRSNRIASVGLSAWLIVVNERLPCVLQVVAATCSSVSYLNTCQTCNPGSDPVASHAQYITNRKHRSPHSRDTESSNERGLRAYRWQTSTFHMSRFWGLDVSKTSFPQPLLCRRWRFCVFVVTIFTPKSKPLGKGHLTMICRCGMKNSDRCGSRADA